MCRLKLSSPLLLFSSSPRFFIHFIWSFLCLLLFLSFHSSVIDSSLSLSTSNHSSLRTIRNLCRCDFELLLMTLWSYENRRRMFNGCCSFKVMRKKWCNYFELFYEEMNNHAKNVIRLLKGRNEELIKILSETKKNKEYCWR